MSQPAPLGVLLRTDLGGGRTLEATQRDFANPALEGRRIFAEAFGTFLLVLAAAGGSVVNSVSGGAVSPAAQAIAPGLTVMAVILFMGATSGAHLNPAVTIAFAARGDFPWRRVPGYVVAQLAGAVVACGLLAALFGDVAPLGATLPGRGITDLQALVVEAVLTVGLVSTILGTASKAQNVGPLAALAVGGYVALAALWAAPISGASMNPARSLGPVLLTGDFAHVWLYVVGPLLGGLLAVGIAHILRGPGGDLPAIQAAQGRLSEILSESRRDPTPPAPAPSEPRTQPLSPGHEAAGRPGEPRLTEPTWFGVGWKAPCWPSRCRAPFPRRTASPPPAC